MKFELRFFLFLAIMLIPFVPIEASIQGPINVKNHTLDFWDSFFLTTNYPMGSFGILAAGAIGFLGSFLKKLHAKKHRRLGWRKKFALILLISTGAALLSALIVAVTVDGESGGFLLLLLLLILVPSWLIYLMALLLGLLFKF
jgi:hypothetical protein